MERALLIVSSLLVAGSLAAGLFALGDLSAAEDLRALLLCGLALAAGLAAHRMLDVGGEGE